MKRLRRVFFWAHLVTGTVAGAVILIIAGIGCVGGAVLVWTGVSLAVRRSSAWMGRRRRTAEIAMTCPDRAA